MRTPSILILLVGMVNLTAALISYFKSRWRMQFLSIIFWLELVFVPGAIFISMAYDETIRIFTMALVFLIAQTIAKERTL